MVDNMQPGNPNGFPHPIPANPAVSGNLNQVTPGITEASTSNIVEELLGQTTPTSADAMVNAQSMPSIVVPPQARATSGALPITGVNRSQSGAQQRVVGQAPVAVSRQASAAAAAAAAQKGAMPPTVLNTRQRGGRLSSATTRSASGGIPVIRFDAVTKVYAAQPNKPALSNITMSINAGEFIFLVGHSGSGKSTFIRLINREILASSGRLAVAGEDVIRMRNWRVPYLRRNIGCVFQDFKLLPNKTAFENVAFALEVIGKSKHIVRTQVPEVLRLVGLEDKLDKYPDQLSGGEQQRVSIARAIVNRPPLLICDEPTGNLDPQTSLGIMRLLDRINRTGTTILVATHDREMVDSLRKRVVELENGYLVRDQDKGVYGSDA